MNTTSFLRTVGLLVLIAARPLSALAQEHPPTRHAQYMYAIAKTRLLRAAEQMPADWYSVPSAQGPRTFGAVIGKAVDLQYRFCMPVLGEAVPSRSTEVSKISKPELIAALNDASTHCDRVFAGLTEATAPQMLRLAREMVELSWLNDNTLSRTLRQSDRLPASELSCLRGVGPATITRCRTR